MRFQFDIPSKGWKNLPIVWISPVRRRGALRNHASFNSATVRALIRPEGNTGGAPTSADPLNSGGLAQFLYLHSPCGAKLPLVITDRPRAPRVARQAVQATVYS